MIVRTHAQRSVGLIGTRYRKEGPFFRVKGITRKRRGPLVDGRSEMHEGSSAARGMADRYCPLDTVNTVNTGRNQGVSRRSVVLGGRVPLFHMDTNRLDSRRRCTPGTALRNLRYDEIRPGVKDTLHSSLCVPRVKFFPVL